VKQNNLSQCRLLRQEVPLILETVPGDDYALIDSGKGRKLERYGSYLINRPEAQALWQPCLTQEIWDGADAVFTGNMDEEGMGRWYFPKGKLGEVWDMVWDNLPFWGRFTSFRHVGVFPEQSAHWHFIESHIVQASKILTRPVRLLNLFGYTGLASLVGARAGAHVTHVDASKKAIGWARENQHKAKLEDRPIRWICEDAPKFVERELRRGNAYDVIVLDPPHYGRGPRGEIWQLFDHLPDLLRSCRGLLDLGTQSRGKALILTAYSIRASFYALHEVMRETMTDLSSDLEIHSGAGLGGCLQSGELILRQLHGDRALSTSLFSRWISA